MKKSWVMQNLQGRRWLGDLRLGKLMDALEQNDHQNLEQAITNEPKPSPKELTRVLERAILFKSDTYVHCVRMLIKHGASVNGCDGRGTPYLVSSVEGGCEQTVRALVAAGSDINMTKQDGCTALHKVVVTGQLELFKLLLNNDCGIVEKLDNLGRTPLLLACSLNYSEMAVDLLDYTKQRCDNGGCCVDICNTPDNSGMYPLYYAISHNNVPLVRQLISHGADIGVAHTCVGITPLMATAYYGFVECTAMLVETEQCDPDVINNEGESALLIAAKRKHYRCFRYLKEEADAEVTVVDKSGNSLLLYVTAYTDIVTDLLDAGVPPNLEGEEGDTPLSVAVELGHVTSLMVLLQHGAEPDPHFSSRVPGKVKPLQGALWKSNLPVVQLLFTCCVEMGYDMTWLEDFLASLHQNEAVSWVVKEMASLENQFPKLLTLCRWNIRESLGDVRLSHRIHSLPLPNVLKDFLMFKELQSFT